MRRSLIITIAALLEMNASSAMAESAEKTIKLLSALTPDIVASQVTLKDDDLEANATFTTLPVYQEKRGLLGIVTNDVFLRAFVDKRTGAVIYQIYTIVTYAASAWQFYGQANYQTSQGIIEVPVQPVSRDVSSCSAYGGCAFTEQVVFEISDDLAHALARTYVPGGSLAIWRFRLKGQGGGDYTDGVAAAEIAGLVQRVDAWRAAHPVAAHPSPPSAPTGALPQMLGIGFTATPYGAYVTLVVPGSRAAKAGITPQTLVTAADGVTIIGLPLAQTQAMLTAAKTLTLSGRGDLAIP